MENIKNYFESYPQSNECHETSDGFLFHEKHAADAHAGTLKDKTVKAHQRTAGAEKEPEFFDHTITQEDLDNNPDFVAKGLQVGDVIQVPVEAPKKPQKKTAKKNAEQ